MPNRATGRQMALAAMGLAAAVLTAGLGVPPAAACCEDIEMIPQEYLGRYVHQHDPGEKSLTVVPVDIDPLGADPMTPWIVHVSTLNVRSGPSTSFSIVGTLSNGTAVSGIYNLVVESDEEWIEIEWNDGTAHISRTGVYRIHPTNQANIDEFGNLPIGQELVNRWWGVPISYEPDDLAEVPWEYTAQSPGRVYLLREEVVEAVTALIDAAWEDGVDFRVSSPYRSGPSQQTIYNRNVQNSGLNQRFSAPPGHSEHQLGTTVDFSSPRTGRFLRNEDPEYEWVAEHGESFGFRQSYTADNIEETGYIEEPWHWRYWGEEPEVSDGWLLY